MSHVGRCSLSECVFFFHFASDRSLSTTLLQDIRQIVTITRFFAHLCLHLQLIDIAISPLAIQIILKEYVQVLEVRPYLYLSAVSGLPLTGLC
jgi:hypothetical protein